MFGNLIWFLCTGSILKVLTIMAYLDHDIHISGMGMDLFGWQGHTLSEVANVQNINHNPFLDLHFISSVVILSGLISLVSIYFEAKKEALAWIEMLMNRFRKGNCCVKFLILTLNLCVLAFLLYLLH